MLTTAPLLSIDVHNMRENPSLVPKKMVAVKIKSPIKGEGKKNQSKRTGRKEVAQCGVCVQRVDRGQVKPRER